MHLSPNFGDVSWPQVSVGRATLIHADAFAWLEGQPAQSVSAVVTDPPYGVAEYSDREIAKLDRGVGGIWRIPPSFDGHVRSALPRFTTLTPSDIDDLCDFYADFGRKLSRVLVPGAHVFVASNPLLLHHVTCSMRRSDLEVRAIVTRLVMTLRGGDRPKNADKEFPDVSVMPRSMHEPWLLLRKPIEGRVQDNLRKWGTGALRRSSAERPFGDVIESHPTNRRERALAPHPSLKPQSFLRRVVRASLPMERGNVLDPFCGSGSTLAAANALGIESIGVERVAKYFALAAEAIPRLQALDVSR